MTMLGDLMDALPVIAAFILACVALGIIAGLVWLLWRLLS